MYLRQKKSGHLVEILGYVELINPLKTHCAGRLHYGEEIQDSDQFEKDDLLFPSGESLPRCWVDVHYRDRELRPAAE